MTHNRLNRSARLPGKACSLSVALCCTAWFGLMTNSTSVAIQNDDSSGDTDVRQLSSLLYQSTISSAEKSLRLDDVRDARKWLDHSPMQLRGWEWRLLDAQCDESAVRIPLADAAVTSLDVSSDGKRLAVATAAGDVTIYAMPGFTPVAKIGDHQEAVYSVAFSQDAIRLVTASRDVTSRVWDVASGKEISRVKLDNPGVAEACFSPTATQVATCTWMMTGKDGLEGIAGVVWIWDAATGVVKFKKPIGIKPLDSLQWSNDGSRIVVGSWGGMVHVVDDEANELMTLTVPDEGVYTAVISVTISPDGKLVAAGSKDRTARVWRLDDGTLQATMIGHGGYVNVVKFTSDGQRLVTASVDGTNRVWDANSGKQLQVLHGHTGNVTAMDVTNDDQRLVRRGVTNSFAAGICPRPMAVAWRCECNRKALTPRFTRPKATGFSLPVSTAMFGCSILHRVKSWTTGPLIPSAAIRSRSVPMVPGC